MHVIDIAYEHTRTRTDLYIPINYKRNVCLKNHTCACIYSISQIHLQPKLYFFFKCKLYINGLHTLFN